MRSVLVVQGDDFGMCGAINEGIATAFADGVLTQASSMVPCPSFDAAMALALSLDLPVGMHQTLTCEWDHLRWGPLTRGRSLVGDDGTFHRTVEAARDAVSIDEATAELVAQAERFLESGNELLYLDAHMGLVCMPAYEAVSERFGRAFLYPGLPRSLPFASICMFSERPADQKKGYLLHLLDKVAAEPGVHLLVTHPAIPSEELDAMTSATSPLLPWASEYRVSDLDVLCDPDIAGRIEELGIELTDVEHGFSP